MAGTSRRAALELSGRGAPDDGSIGVRLLGDVRAAFADLDRLSTRALIDKLAEDEEAPWSAWHKGARVSPRALARLLEPFGIRSTTVRIGDDVAKGYRREDFADPWTRYLPAHSPAVSVTPLQPAWEQGKPPEPIRYTTPDVTDAKRDANPHEQRDVTDVTDRNGGQGRFAVDESDFAPIDEAEVQRVARIAREAQR
jgi:hypothetical protein